MEYYEVTKLYALILLDNEHVEFDVAHLLRE